MPPPTEKEFSRLADELATRMGWHIERYEQQRATHIAPGLPDRRYCILRRQRVWVELKRPGGKLTALQYQWLKTELAAGGLACVVDSLDVLARILRDAASNNQLAVADARRYCEEIVDLVAQRGYRAT